MKRPCAKLLLLAISCVLLAPAALPQPLPQVTFTQIQPDELTHETCPTRLLNRQKPYALGWSPFPPGTCSFPCGSGYNLPTHQSYATTAVQTNVNGLEVLGQFLVHGTGPVGASRFLAFFHRAAVAQPCLDKGDEYGLSVDLATKTMTLFQCHDCVAGSKLPGGSYYETAVYSSPQDILRYRITINVAGDFVFDLLNIDYSQASAPITVPRQIPPMAAQGGLVSIMSRQDAPASFRKSALFADELSVGK